MHYAGVPLSSIQQLVEAYVIPSQLVLAMVGMGATLTVQNFVDVIKDKKGLLIGLGLQLVFVPALTLAFIEAFDLSKGWAVGLILVAVVPGGAFSNLLTYLGKGNAALSVSITTISTAGCLLTIPILLSLFVGQYMPPDFRVPTARIVRDILAFLLLPLSAGMVLLRASQRAAFHTARWGIRGSVFLLICIVVSSLGTGRIKLEEFGWGPPLSIILFGNVLWIAAAQLCRLLRRYDDDTVALTIEVSVRNMAVALLLVHFFFEGEPAQRHVLYTCLFYAGMSFFIGIPIVLRHRRGHSPAWFWPARARPSELRAGAE